MVRGVFGAVVLDGFLIFSGRGSRAVRALIFGWWIFCRGGGWSGGFENDGADFFWMGGEGG